MSNSEPSSSSPTGTHSSFMNGQDADAERRWATWRARGIVQERVVHQRFVAVAIVAAALAVAALAGYGMLFP